MNFNTKEGHIRVYLDEKEAVAFYNDFFIVKELGYDHNDVGKFVYDNLLKSVQKNQGFEVTISPVFVKELLEDLNYKLSRTMHITRVTRNLIDNLTYYIMSDNQKTSIIPPLK
jgi:hypothetical protein